MENILRLVAQGEWASSDHGTGLVVCASTNQCTHPFDGDASSCSNVLTMLPFLPLQAVVAVVLLMRARPQDQSWLD